MPTYNDIKNSIGGALGGIASKASGAIGGVFNSPTYGTVQQNTTDAVGLGREGFGIYTDAAGRINSMKGGNVFSTVTGVIDFIKFGQNIFNKVNLLPPGADIPPEYIIRISSEFESLNGSAISFIEAPIQESIKLRVDSEWKSIIPTKASAIFMAFTGKSLISKKVSRRLWVGTSPIQISVTLKLDAVDDAKLDVVNKACFIQRLILPYLQATPGSINDILQLLNPPGPSPFSFDPVEFDRLEASDNTGLLSEVWNLGKEAINKTEEAIEKLIESASKYAGKGDRITINIGRFLTFDNVIVKESTVEYYPKFTSDGSPISATINLVFETYEIYTKQDIYRAYNYTQSTNTQTVLQNADRIEEMYMKDF